MNKTITVKCDDRSEPCVLIEGPMWADAKFYGRWLLAAAKAEAHRVDEVKNIRDWAVAAQVYAKQARDLTLIKHATDIRLRAERRAGELLKQMGTKKARHSGRGHTTRVGSRAVTFASPFATDLESKGRKKQERGPASPRARPITASRSR